MPTYFEDMLPETEFLSPGRTIGESDVIGFAALSGDWFPLHTDEEYAKTTPYKTRVAHGLFGLALTEGLKFRIPAFADVRYVASLYWNYQFTLPLFPGDTVNVAIRIQEKRLTRTPGRGLVVEHVRMLNQHGAVVGEGDHGLLIKCRDPEACR